jgi:hypothetical protein
MCAVTDRDAARESFAGDIEADLHLALYTFLPGLGGILRNDRAERLALVVGVDGFDIGACHRRRPEDAYQ